MKPTLRIAVLAAALAPLAASAASPPPATRARAAVPIRLPGAKPHAGFDDMGFVPALDRIVVPGGDSGRLFLVDPQNSAATVAARVTPAGRPKGRHDAGTTSAAYAHGYFMASDHANRSLAIVRARDGKVVAHVKLAAGSDYVRYVAPVKQIWVTEPDAHQIQIFDATFGQGAPRLKRAGTIAIPGGPEALVVDAKTGRAYTNLWKHTTLAIGLRSHKIAARWPNDCKGSRGLALAPKKGLLFVGCTEGKAVALNLANHGAVAASAKTGAGVDIIAWNPARDHLYVPGARSATLTILALGAHDRLTTVATIATAKGAHCVATDGRSHAFVCDPRHGRVLDITDPH